MKVAFMGWHLEVCTGQESARLRVCAGSRGLRAVSWTFVAARKVAGLPVQHGIR